MRRLFFGWYVAIACGLASIITTTFSIFLGPLRAEFGWTPSQTFLRLLLTRLKAFPKSFPSGAINTGRA